MANVTVFPTNATTEVLPGGREVRRIPINDIYRRTEVIPEDQRQASNVFATGVAVVSSLVGGAIGGIIGLHLGMGEKNASLPDIATSALIGFASGATVIGVTAGLTSRALSCRSSDFAQNVANRRAGGEIELNNGRV